jgi:hypothetical protein
MTLWPQRTPDAQRDIIDWIAGTGFDRLGAQDLPGQPVAADKKAAQRGIPFLPFPEIFGEMPDIPPPPFGAIDFVAGVVTRSAQDLLGMIWNPQRALHHSAEGRCDSNNQCDNGQKAKHGEISQAMPPHSLALDSGIAFGSASKLGESFLRIQILRLIQHPDSRSDALCSVLDEDGGVIAAALVRLVAALKGCATLKRRGAVVPDGRAFAPVDGAAHAGLVTVVRVGHGKSPMKKAARWGRLGHGHTCGVDKPSPAANDNVVNSLFPAGRVA